MAHGKGGHQFFHAPLAKRAFYIAVMAHDELIKFVTAVFAVVFVDRHGAPPCSNVLKKDKFGWTDSQEGGSMGEWFDKRIEL
jgi:hypothetical protein